MKTLKKSIIILIILLLSQSLVLNMPVKSQAITLKILDPTTNSDSKTIGSETEPVPREGIPFSVKVLLEGSVSNLIAFQISIRFDYPSVNCSKEWIWIPYDDPNFIFYGIKQTLEMKAINPITKNIVSVGVTIIDFTKAVSKSGEFLLCMINFTGNKIGGYTLEFDQRSEYTMLLNSDAQEVPITNFRSFTINILGAKAPPCASLKVSPNPVKANRTVTFDASGSYDPDGNITKYIWIFGDGSINVTDYSIIKHKYKKNGLYNATVVVIDNDGYNDTATLTVIVGTMPIVTFVVNPSGNIKPAETVTFDASGSYDPDGNITKYIWIFGDGSNATTDTPTITHVYEKRGVYKVSLTVVDDEGLFNSTAKTILIGIPPRADFTFSPENPRVGEDVQFDASRSEFIEKPIVRFVWYFEDTGLNQTTELPLITYAFLTAGNWTVMLTVYDEDGLYGTVSHIVPVTLNEIVQSGIRSEFIAATAIVIMVIVLVGFMVKKRRKKEEIIEI